MNNSYINEDYVPGTPYIKAPSISIDDLDTIISGVLEKVYEEAVMNGLEDRLTAPDDTSYPPMVDLMCSYILGESWIPRVSKCSALDKIKADIDGVLSLEDLQGYDVVDKSITHVLKNGVPVEQVRIVGQERDCIIFVYWDGENLRAYVPVKGNWVNLQNRMIFGDNRVEDEPEIIRQGLTEDYLEEDSDAWDPNEEACIGELYSMFV